MTGLVGTAACLKTTQEIRKPPPTDENASTTPRSRAAGEGALRGDPSESGTDLASTTQASGVGKAGERGKYAHSKQQEGQTKAEIDKKENRNKEKMKEPRRRLPGETILPEAPAGQAP